MEYSITIELPVYQKLKGYIKAATGEVSGLAKVERFDNGDVFFVTDIYLFDQVCTSTTTKIDPDSLAKFYDDLMQRGEDPGLWKCWWHSHANMQTFWSSTDEDTVKSLDPETTSDNLIFAIVGNKKGEFLCRIDSFSPLRVTLDKVDWDIGFYNQDVEEQCKKEVAEKVHEPAAIIRTPEVVHRNYNTFQHSGNYNRDPRDFIDDPSLCRFDADYDFRHSRPFKAAYTTKELTGGDVEVSTYIDETGVYVLGKDGLYHLKCNSLTKAERKAVKKAQASSDRLVKQINDQAYQNYLDSIEEYEDELDTNMPFTKIEIPEVAKV